MCSTVYLVRPGDLTRGKKTTCSRACSYRLRMETRRPVGRPKPPEVRRETLRAKRARYYARNAARISVRSRLYVQARPEQHLAHYHARRARLAGCAVNDLTLADWRAILEEYGHRCAYCGRDDVALTRDHVVPLCKGGNHTRSNVVPACRSCNTRKGTRIVPFPRPADWELAQRLARGGE